MLFTSYTFLFLFLPAVLLSWWSFRDTKLRLLVLTAASYLFYSWWNWRFLPLIIATTAVDYMIGSKISRCQVQGTRRGWLMLSLLTDLGLLGLFKYYGFVSGFVNSAATRVGVSPVLPNWQLILPVGISFYTFNSLGYTIDIFRRKQEPSESLLHYAAFVSMFPHLIAGPIVRYSDVGRQLERIRASVNWERIARGLFFFSIGLCKKVLIADRLAVRVNTIFFADPSLQGFAGSWLGALGYTFQLYFDFSAYSDMAVGLACFLGIDFPQNFDSPYKAESIADFWRRWHITLSHWFRDYVYIPMGGSRTSDLGVMRNLLVTMLLVGLWHGANWTFVAWGAYHGVLLAVHRFASRRGFVMRSVVLARVCTFFAVLIGWVVFRSQNFSLAWQMLAGMAGMRGMGPYLVSARYLVLLMVAAGISFFSPNTWEVQLKPDRRLSWLLAAAMALCVLLMSQSVPFLYYQF